MTQEFGMMWAVLIVVDGQRYAADELAEPDRSAYAAAVAALGHDATIPAAADALEQIVAGR
jgi:hypothetical protein